jgi:hypothetical protein
MLPSFGKVVPDTSTKAPLFESPQVSKFTSPQDACKATPLRYRPCPDHPTIRQLDEYKVRAESAEIEEMIRGKRTNMNIRASVSKSDAVALLGDGGALENIKPTVASALPKEEPEIKNPKDKPKKPKGEKDGTSKAELVMPAMDMSDAVALISEVRDFADAVSKEIGKGAEMIMKLSSLGAGSDIATVITECKGELEVSYAKLKKLSMEGCDHAETYRPDMAKCRAPYAKIKKFIRCGAAVASQLEGPKAKKAKTSDASGK